MKKKIVGLYELTGFVTDGKKKGKKIVATSGCFDILHSGHVAYLEEAAEKGDMLIVFLNSDKSVQRLKGKQHPIVPEFERAFVLAGLQCVDYICIFEEDTPCEVLEKVCPSVFVKGEDYKGKYISEMTVMERIGGIVEYCNYVQGCSSTNIVKRIMQLYASNFEEDI